MKVTNLYEVQFKELREKLLFAYNEDDLEAIGANTEEWTSAEWDNWSRANICNPTLITDEMVIKAFGDYDFGIDDFFTTAGQYTTYPDKD